MSVSNLPRMTERKGGRPSDYTPEEDAIILSVTDTKDCQRLLREAGFPERTPAAIWSRRDHLRKAGATEADISGLAQAEEARILFARRSKLQQRHVILQAECDELQAEITAITERLRGLV